MVKSLFASFTLLGLTLPENIKNQGKAETEVEQLTNYLANKHILLMDNLEQLLDDAAARMIMSLLSHAPNLQILTTSREMT